MSNFLDHVKDAAGSLSALFTTEAGAVDDPVLQSIIDQMDQEAIHLAGGRKLTQVRPKAPPTALHPNKSLASLVNFIQACQIKSDDPLILQASPLINDPFYVNRTQYYVDLINATGAWMYTQGM